MRVANSEAGLSEFGPRGHRVVDATMRSREVPADALQRHQEDVQKPWDGMRDVEVVEGVGVALVVRLLVPRKELRRQSQHTKRNKEVGGPQGQGRGPAKEVHPVRASHHLRRPPRPPITCNSSRKT